MRIVIYKNPNAIFGLLLPDVVDRLKYYSDQNIREATEMLNSIASSLLKVIEVESGYFGYMVLDLKKVGKGHAYCNVCKQMYDSNQLMSKPLGFGKTSFSIKLKEKGGFMKRRFSKKR
jgi:hypothetical protein